MTKQQLAACQNLILVDPACLRNLQAIMTRTDTAAFRDAQNTVVLLIDQAQTSDTPA